MSEIKSPYLVARQEFYFDSDIVPCQLSHEAEQQRKVVLRAARIRPEKRSSVLWCLVVDVALWTLLIMGGRWVWMLFR